MAIKAELEESSKEEEAEKLGRSCDAKAILCVFTQVLISDVPVSTSYVGTSPPPAIACPGRERNQPREPFSESSLGNRGSEKEGETQACVDSRDVQVRPVWNPPSELIPPTPPISIPCAMLSQGT